MRRVIAIAAALFAMVASPASSQPVPLHGYVAFSDAQKADLARISAYLNAVRTLHAAFLQVGPDGSSVEGVVYISKPGQMRFEFRPPSPILIVATGGQVYVKNSKLNTVDNYDLSDTPLGLLLNDTVDLTHNRSVIGLEERDGEIVVKARTATNRSNANITLVFSAPNIELRQWTVKDNQGGITTVALQNVETGVSINPGAFAVPLKAPRQPSKG